MSGERYTLDANILFYFLDAGAAEKHTRAAMLVQAAMQRRAVITVQTLGEICNAVARKQPDLLPRTQRIVQRFTVVMEAVPAEPGDLLEAMRIRQSRPVQFWDAMLWATAKRVGCTTILTEDTHDRPVSEGVRYLNPFQSPDDPDLANFLSA